MNLVLIGYRGTGKSAVGRLVAERLGMECIGLDARIVKRAGMPIREIVERQGWPHFRDLESAEVRRVAALDNVVIDTGGGVIERSENVEVLRAQGCVIWLKASVEVIIPRIQGDTERPSLTGDKTLTEEVSEVLERRVPSYQSAAHHEVDTDSVTVKQVADRVIEIWRESRSAVPGESPC